MIRKHIFLIIFIICFSIPTAYSQIIGSDEIIKQIDKFVTQTDSNKQQIDIVDLSGSTIIKIIITLEILNGNSNLCYLQLSDSSLNEIRISGDFVCNSIQTIELNELGNDAIETKHLTDFNIIQKDTNTTLDFKATNYDLTYIEPTYYAKIENNKVVDVIVASKTFVETLNGQWIETKTDGSIRNMYAGIGFDYDFDKDEFISSTKDEIIIIDNGTGT